MFSKLLVIVACLGTVAGGLLAARHQRLQTARESIRLHQRLEALRHAEWAVDLQIAARLRPDLLQEAVAALGGPWAPLPAEPAVETPRAMVVR